MHSPLLEPGALEEALPGLVVLDARTGPKARSRYLEGHLPGAYFVDLEADLAAPNDHPEAGGRHPLPPVTHFGERLGRFGIGPATKVLVYDEASGANAAARAWWMLRAIGHERVWVLDGGLAAARAAGVPLTTEVPAEVDLPPYESEGYGWPTASFEEVDAARLDPARRVLDVRSATRFRGEEEPMDPIAGRIPGAANHFYGEHLDLDGRFRPAPEVRAQLERALGGVPADRTIVHCGSGVTACETLLAMAYAGLPIAALYVGSWSEWCRREAPRATGPTRPMPEEPTQ
jgi:thiosulfate/3-mercaptopyruvate sulfurtransferase